MLGTKTDESVSHLCYWVFGNQIYEYLAWQIVLATTKLSIVFTVLAV